MKKKILTLILLIAFVTMGCSSMKVVVDYDDQINFSKYRTFNFVSPKKVAKKKAKNPAV
ncbi:hypothetical protein ISS22_12295, partial [candidate division KSB1 bacterium]|nr:hypothetical protein [candidate division KSB1 bacterium]